MSQRKIPRYRQKFGETKPHYAHKKCAHGHGHVQHLDNVRYLVCDVCNTILDNALTAKLDRRRFRGDRFEERKAA